MVFGPCCPQRISILCIISTVPVIVALFAVIVIFVFQVPGRSHTAMLAHKTRHTHVYFGKHHTKLMEIGMNLNKWSHVSFLLVFVLHA